MKKRIASLFLLVCLLLSAMTLPISFADENSKLLVCSTADEWTALFDRRNQKSKQTWLGADGIYSVSLDGNDAMSSADENTKTFFIFSDTLMGTSDSSGRPIRQAATPAQSSAMLTGNTANAENLSFVYGRGGNMNVGEHLFGEHKWMLDCLVIGNKLYILGFPEQDWKPKQIDLITMPISNGEVVYSKYRKTANIKQLCYRDGDRYLYAFGIGITPNTESAGAPNPDGYIYIYGYRDAMQEFSRKDLIVARIAESDFPEFKKLSYWEGDGWGTDIEKCAILLDNVSCEMSVTPVTVGPYAGKYIAVYTHYTQSAEIMYSIGDSLTGPFDTPVEFYHAPEHGTTGASGSGERYVYNAKAHPHLSEGDKLLVSYNVNVMNAQQYTVDYHPRFLWLDLDPDHDYVPGQEQNTAEPESPQSEKTEKSFLPFILAGAGVALVAAGAAVTVIAIKRKKKA